MTPSPRAVLAARRPGDVLRDRARQPLAARRGRFAERLPVASDEHGEVGARPVGLPPQDRRDRRLIPRGERLAESEVVRQHLPRLGEALGGLREQPLQHPLPDRELVVRVAPRVAGDRALDQRVTRHLHRQQQDEKHDHDAGLQAAEAECGQAHRVASDVVLIDDEPLPAAPHVGHGEARGRDADLAAARHPAHGVRARVDARVAVQAGTRLAERHARPRKRLQHLRVVLADRARSLAQPR